MLEGPLGFGKTFLIREALKVVESYRMSNQVTVYSSAVNPFASMTACNGWKDIFVQMLREVAEQMDTTPAVSLLYNKQCRLLYFVVLYCTVLTSCMYCLCRMCWLIYYPPIERLVLFSSNS